MADIGTGFQPGQSPSDRRSAFDLRRRLRVTNEDLQAQIDAAVAANAATQAEVDAAEAANAATQAEVDALETVVANKFCLVTFSAAAIPSTAVNTTLLSIASFSLPGVQVGDVLDLDFWVSYTAVITGAANINTVLYLDGNPLTPQANYTPHSAAHTDRNTITVRHVASSGVAGTRTVEVRAQASAASVFTANSGRVNGKVFGPR